MSTAQMTTTAETFNILIKKIAQNHFDIETLETRNSDSLDFHDVAVWQIKKALEDAFRAGMEVGLTINN